MIPSTFTSSLCNLNSLYTCPRYVYYYPKYNYRLVSDINELPVILVDSILVSDINELPVILVDVVGYQTQGRFIVAPWF